MPPNDAREFYNPRSSYRNTALAALLKSSIETADMS